MTLAQVVYQMSTDADFASQLIANPEATLAKRGMHLSQEELAFLLTARSRSAMPKARIVAMADEKAKSWGA